MPAVLSADMARPKKQDEKPKHPNDPVRFIAEMSRAERARLARYCDHFGVRMEKLGREWLLDRLAAEEKKLGW
jgi:hypothetical protein